MNNLFENNHNLYSLIKTICMGLTPIERTQEMIEKNGILKKDEERANKYILVKKLADECHKAFINNVLLGFKFDEKLREYYNCYRNSEKDKLKDIEKHLRTNISNAFTKNPDYKKLSSKNLIEFEIENYAKSDEEKVAVKMFQKFATYLKNYTTSRKNMYVKEEKSTSVAYRIINQNLPKFIDNIIAFEKIINSDFKNQLDELNQKFKGLGIYDIKDLFTIDYFNFAITQQGIEKYNNVLGGYSNSDGTKVQGINEKIESYNTGNKDKPNLPFLKPLYKQILSDTESISFIPEQFKDSKELLNTLSEFFNEKDSANKNYLEYLDELKELFASLNNFESNKIYIKNGPAIPKLSQGALEHRGCIFQKLNDIYDKENSTKKSKDFEKYSEQRRKHFKSIDSYNVKYLDDITNNDNKILNYLSSETIKLIDAALSEYNKLKPLLEHDYPENKNLKSDEDSIKIIKDALESIMHLKKFIKPLLGSGKEVDKDTVFYGQFEPLFEKINEITPLYNKARNYLTQKPYSIEKIKLTFGKGNLLNGWVDSKTESSDNGTQYCGYIFRKKNVYNSYDYFLGISRNIHLLRESNNVSDYSQFERLSYYQIKSQMIFGNLYKCNRSYNQAKSELKNIIYTIVKDNNYANLANLKLDDDAKTPIAFLRTISDDENLLNKVLNDKNFLIINDEIIHTVKESFKSILNRFPIGEKIINKNYKYFYEIVEDTEKICSNKSITYYHISEKELQESLNDNTKPLYLFKIYNKDLNNPNSHGNKNLHTIYFEELLNGNGRSIDIGTGEMFFRKKSIETPYTHYANEIVVNRFGKDRTRIPENIHKEFVDFYNNKTTTLTKAAKKYKDNIEFHKTKNKIIKDRRFTVDNYFLHLSLTLNYKNDKMTNEKEFNNDVRKAIQSTDGINIIGIDRGERNLIYVTVIDSNGKIIEQYSLNEIVNEYNGNTYKTDYHQLLDYKEKERKQARQEWKTIENIKELKEGYLSQVVHKIVQLMTKYNAIVVLEDLESGMKQGRKKVDKQVYQKFENALINKLKFCVDKKLPAEAKGGLLNAYQLVNSDSVKGKQNGLIFYIPPWNTSKIDPVTGFVNLFDLRLTSKDLIFDFISKFDNISYNKEKDYFEFKFDYHNFGKRCLNDYRRNWTVCTVGERIRTFRNPNKNNEYDNEVVNLTEEFKNLFSEYNIDIHSENLIKEIQDKKETLDLNFFKEFIKLFKLTVQLRNSKTGSTLKEDDYLISPVANKNGEFYDSRNYSGENANLPQDADANGAYNIARKGLFVVNQIKSAKSDKELKDVKFSMSNKEWLEYTQKQDM